MKEGEIRRGTIPLHRPKLFVKRLFGLKLRYRCLECSKGHDGLIVYITGSNGVGGFTKVADFCTFSCASKYIFKHGYSLKQKITDEKDICIICKREHHNQFFNLENKVSIRAFCSKKCLDKASALVPKLKDQAHRTQFKKILDLFKEGKTRKDLEHGEPQYFENLIIDEHDLIDH